VSAGHQGSHLAAFNTKFVEVQVKMQKAEQRRLRQNLRLGWNFRQFSPSPWARNKYICNRKVTENSSKINMMCVTMGD